MAFVRDLLNDDGWGVTDVHTAGEGFDLLARRGHKQRCIEVKGVWDSASSRGITLTGNEIVKAGLLGSEYWLYVVDECHATAGASTRPTRTPPQYSRMSPRM